MTNARAPQRLRFPVTPASDSRPPPPGARSRPDLCLEFPLAGVVALVAGDLRLALRRQLVPSGG